MWRSRQRKSSRRFMVQFLPCLGCMPQDISLRSLLTGHVICGTIRRAKQIVGQYEYVRFTRQPRTQVAVLTSHAYGSGDRFRGPSQHDEDHSLGVVDRYWTSGCGGYWTWKRALRNLQKAAILTMGYAPPCECLKQVVIVLCAEEVLHQHQQKGGEL